MLRNKTVVSLILAATFLVMVSPLFMAIYAQTQNPEQQNVREQKFMEIAIQARERAYELKDLVIEKIGNIPDEIEDLLILGEIGNKVDALTHAATELEEINDSIRENIKELQGIAEMVGKAANAVKILVALAVQAAAIIA